MRWKSRQNAARAANSRSGRCMPFADIVRLSGENLVEEGKVLSYRRQKTGALIESSMMIGALLAGAEDAELEKVQKIASDVGIAFQIQDDILDVTSTTEELGKPVHSDEKNEKTTYVTLKGLEKATRDVEVISQEALELLSGLDRENTYLTQLIQELIHRKK